MKLSIEMFKRQLKHLNVLIWIFDLDYIRIEKSNYRSHWNDLDDQIEIQLVNSLLQMSFLII